MYSDWFLRIQVAGQTGTTETMAGIQKDSPLHSNRGTERRSLDLNGPSTAKERGDVHLKLEELGEAEQCYRQFLASEPFDSGALISLGFVLRQLGHSRESAEFIDRALEIVPDNADAHYIRGTLHQANRDLPRAITHFEEALGLQPDLEFAYRDLIVCLFQMGRVPEAMRWCDRGLDKVPNSGELHFYRSNLHKHVHATRPAIASAIKALEFRAGLLAARASLTELLQKAEQECRLAGEVESGSENNRQQWREIAAGYAALGRSYFPSAEFAAARSALERASVLSPNISEHHYYLATALRNLQEIDAAAASLDRAIALDPDDARPRWAKSLLPASAFPSSRAAAEQARASILAALETFDDWSRGRNLHGRHLDGHHSAFFLSYQELDNRPVFERYGAVCARSASSLKDDERAIISNAEPRHSSRLRIGIVSADVREHSVWFALIKGWLDNLDRTRFEVAVFSLGTTIDRETEWAKLHADYFISGPKSIRDWADSIRALACPVLMYPAIGMEMTTLQLASLRLAPTQINTWGHPETSGLPTIDLYLSGESFEQADAQRFYTEKLVLLSNLGNCYQGRVQRIDEPDLAALGIDPTRPILVCPGTAFKYQVEYDGVLTQIAKRIDGAQLVFFRHPEHLSAILRARLERTFFQEGLDFDRHVRFLPHQRIATFHGLLSRASVALDTIGFSGYNTAIQAIECGLPLVTLDGQFLRGRLASGILRQLRMTDLIAQTTEDYVNLCERLITDVSFNERIRTELVQRRMTLYGDTTSVRHLEEVIEETARHRSRNAS